MMMQVSPYLWNTQKSLSKKKYALYKTKVCYADFSKHPNHFHSSELCGQSYEYPEPNLCQNMTFLVPSPGTMHGVYTKIFCLQGRGYNYNKANMTQRTEPEKGVLILRLVIIKLR